MSWQQRIDQALDARRAARALRTRTALHGLPAGRIGYQGRRWLNFSGNDYLGLSHHPAVIRGWQQGADEYGVGSAGSGHVTGYAPAHQQLEAELAQWLGYPRALLFISGFAANQAVIHALMAKDDRILADRLAHASLLEAAALSPAGLRRFTHNDPASLGRLLEKPLSGQQLVITEGVFSMDGDQAPLAEIARHSQRPDTLLMIDDAHGAGATGPQGRGSCALAGIHPDILVVTFGKAFGVSGAAVLCSEALADYLLQFARHLIYSTAMPPAQAVALQAALGVIRSPEGDALRGHLDEHIDYFRAASAGLPLTRGDSHTAIQPLITGDNARALTIAARLRERGLWVTAIRPPTVPPGTARLRITLTAAHTRRDIDTLLEGLAHVCQ
ncbi:8-amino-7-oxononanoate synthase [Shimwellia blattae]|uniref:8-amino-7-oxononanoate synthase n=1 Tax=Shimwellia blattae (strain ATCC 29907 / DSM 4481 / JCM 1650 / NBRC 105725 / CDC 9005-74) TaxID=630626 RepID=I2BB02_SHIBC|nr:8-amino-7-oxononanoate synthase [Shimwellia blattae]AFJ47706.1 8-amino-7-oxononanoate synthase [Shimwellia blattae DSM 4481 = NBRC 105725]GAB79715.1 8-amino-7-oxononanoate synthase [Shimwellia blattae DSM 4481 = NBRC 105725]VDY65204.1 8-amino-7-oxononanoate synthase [Shimwellia blattae]VEC23891.1 8-amino-7-oxononanoate synthase [Shimwellia blattae]